MTTSLKIRSVSSQDTPQGPASVINDYDDYREVKGVRIPYKVTISGAMPFPLVMQVESAAINEGIDDKVFTIK
jgi:zinc protease